MEIIMVFGRIMYGLAVKKIIFLVYAVIIEVFGEIKFGTVVKILNLYLIVCHQNIRTD